MAKVLIGVDFGKYAFNATAGTITFTEMGTVKLEAVLLITNVRDNVIIYNFSNPALGGTLTGDVLTLDYATGAMGNTDPLQIWYYAPDAMPVADVNTLEQVTAVRQLAQFQAGNMAMPDNAGRMRVILEGTNNIGTVSTVTTVNTVNTLGTITNLTSFGGYFGNPHIPYTMQIAVEVQMQKIVIT